MKLIQLKPEDVMPADEVEGLMGRFMRREHYRHLVANESATVLKPDGTPLLIYIKDALPRSLCRAAFDIFKKIDFEAGGSNRGMAAGLLEEHTEATAMPDELAYGAAPGGRGLRINPINADGTMSKTSRAVNVPTSIIGYFDRYPRIPYCRQTAFTMNNPELWTGAIPYIQQVSRVFEQYAPTQFAAQKNFVEHCHPDFIIPGTIFSTLTVNRNWQTALHRDAGDFRSGLGCMTVLQGGEYTGGELVFPEYGVAVDMRTGGIALADVHVAHGNTKIEGTPGKYVRLSAVFYCREKIAECGSAEFELERAKRIGDRIATTQATQELKLF